MPVELKTSSKLIRYRVERGNNMYSVGYKVATPAHGLCSARQRRFTLVFDTAVTNCSKRAFMRMHDGCSRYQ